MKVLMFGWEFPPHISGGLGTACEGLTRALVKADVDVLFAIPRLQGGEQADHTTFINASSIPIRQKKLLTEAVQANNPFAPEKPAVPMAREPAPLYQASGRRGHTTERPLHSVLEIPVSLSAYASPGSDRAFALQQWNYELASTKNALSAGAQQHIAHDTAGALTPRAAYVKEPYAFSGTYGDNLLEEVDHYAKAAGEIARRHAFDIIHAHDWMTYPAGIAAKKRSGKPLIVHVHATEIDRSGVQVNPKVFAIEKEGMQVADKVIAVSHWTKDIAVKHYGIDRRKIEVVHNGITPRIAGQTACTASPLRAPVVTFLGRITHQKGPMYFVEAARRVHEKLPDVHFVVAGSGDQLPNMIEMIARAKLSPYFHFTGFLRAADVDRVWAMSNVYVMPSVSEPFGIAPLEAIQAGVPVIVSKQAGVGEVMPHAIKVDFWNTDALADAICSLLRFRSLANTLKRNGADHIKKITWDKAANKLTTLYYELHAKHERTKEPDPLLSSSPTKKITTASLL